MTKLEKIKEEVKLIEQGTKYLNNPKLTDAQISNFLPRYNEKMKNLCMLVEQLERETGGKFNWDMLELSEPEQISFKCGL